MKQEINPAVAAVVVVLVLLVVGFLGYTLMGKKSGGSNEAANDPRYKAYSQGVKKG